MHDILNVCICVHEYICYTLLFLLEKCAVRIIYTEMQIRKKQLNQVQITIRISKL